MFTFKVVTTCNLLISLEKKGKLCQKMTIRKKKNPPISVRRHYIFEEELYTESFLKKHTPDDTVQQRAFFKTKGKSKEVLPVFLQK